MVVKTSWMQCQCWNWSQSFINDPICNSQSVHRIYLIYSITIIYMSIHWLNNSSVISSDTTLNPESSFLWISWMALQVVLWKELIELHECILDWFCLELPHCTFILVPVLSLGEEGGWRYWFLSLQNVVTLKLLLKTIELFKRQLYALL